MAPRTRTAVVAVVAAAGVACAVWLATGPTGPDAAAPGATGTAGSTDGKRSPDGHSTAAAGGATRIAVAGDTGTGPGSPIDRTVAAMVAREEEDGEDYDALLLLGDLVYPRGDGGQADRRITRVFEPVTERGARLVAVLGNHDYRSHEQEQILAETGRTRSWYAERVGDVRLVVLDTQRVDDPAQTAWLTRTLAGPTDADWTVVAMHKPAYSAGAHGSTPEVQKRWVPLFERFGVPLVLAGHDHDYQRSTVLDGVTYVVSGGAATLRPTGRAAFTAFSESVLHYVEVVADADALSVRAVSNDGTVIDASTIARRRP